MNRTARLLPLCRIFIILSTCATLFCWSSLARADSSLSVPPPQINNANSQELENVEQLISQLDAAVGARDINALKFYSLTNAAQKYFQFISHTQITHLAVAPAGALVRLHYDISGKVNASASAVPVQSGDLDIWLKRESNGFAFTSRIWIPSAAPHALLAQTTRQAWQESARGILQLVVDRRGGRWIPLRQMRWKGVLASGAVLAQLQNAQHISPTTYVDEDWITQQLARHADDGAGTIHLFFQSSDTGWVGVGNAWDSNSSNSANSADAALTTLRQQIDGQGFLSASVHRDFGKALADIGLYAEATTQLEQASALSPASVDADLLARVKGLRNRDPETLAANQLQSEARIGLDPMHPSYQIQALIQKLPSDPTPLSALRLGAEYSQLGDDDKAAQMLQQVQALIAQQDVGNMNASDKAWAKVLLDHLQERVHDAALKPPNLIRSSLFTVRCWIDDPNSLPLLAALEEAQHTVYADFNIPMDNTEVLLWQNQTDFQRYTTRFSDTGHSEFVTALTLTKLINSRQGPVVLSEEMNIYSSPSATWFSTIAHEYGHVAVRQMSRARDVPTWLNEGIACVVEGGYSGYKQRLHRAAQNNALLSMNDLLQWQVDGERAFLAYSQANSMVDYIIAHWGGNALLQILRSIGGGMSADEAFSTTLQMNQRQLWQAWRSDGVP